MMHEPSSAPPIHTPQTHHLIGRHQRPQSHLFAQPEHMDTYHSRQITEYRCETSLQLSLQAQRAYIGNIQWSKNGLTRSAITPPKVNRFG